MKGFNYKKATQALNYLAGFSTGNFNKLKAIKLIWLADRLHLRRFGRTITGDLYVAMEHGPVPSSTRNLLQNNKFALDEDALGYKCGFIKETDSHHYTSVNPTDLKVFSKSDRDVLDEVLRLYGGKSKFELRDFSHDFPEWKKFESSLKGGFGRSFPMDLEDFFINVDDGTGTFVNDEEYLQASKEIYEENKLIQSLLHP